jgi:peptidoglycan/xylan/chitin deacetylase (PgdA/CDA1 family)
MGDLLVLCYHAVSERWPAALSVTSEAFEQQLRLLSTKGFKGETFDRAVSGEPDGRTVAVTFDDAYLSVFELARPILDDAGFPATVFVPTDYPASPDEPMDWDGIDKWLGGPYERELRPMSWEQLGTLADAGWEIGSHTCSHPRLPSLGEEDLARELTHSRSTVGERLGRPCGTLAYPYGDHDARVLDAARAAGYAAAGTLPGRLPRARRLAWPRIGIYRGDDERRFRLKASAAVRRLRGTRLWPSERA